MATCISHVNQICLLSLQLNAYEHWKCLIVGTRLTVLVVRGTNLFGILSLRQLTFFFFFVNIIPNILHE